MTDQAQNNSVRDWLITISAITSAVVVSLLVVGVLTRLSAPGQGQSIARPATVIVQPRTLTYRPDGDFQRNNYPVDAPLEMRKLNRAFEIMKHQVTMADYMRCVADGACFPAETLPHNPNPASDNKPAVGISYDDAVNYAQWLSEKTGELWHLPSDEQWAYAAGSRLVDNAVGVSGEDAANPAIRWLREYEIESARKDTRNPTVRPIGAFGENELGIADVGGNVWEWTNTCHRRVKVDAKGKIESEVKVCGVYVANGQHRAAMSSFIRNPKSGGCSVGVPPDNLGFRLVNDRRWYSSLINRLRKLI